MGGGGGGGRGNRDREGVSVQIVLLRIVKYPGLMLLSERGPACFTEKVTAIS